MRSPTACLGGPRPPSPSGYPRCSPAGHHRTHGPRPRPIRPRCRCGSPGPPGSAGDASSPGGGLRARPRSNPHRVSRRGHRGPRSLPAGAHSRGPSVQPIPRPSTRPVGHPAARRRTPPGRDPGRGMTHHRRIRALDCECSRLAAKAPPPHPRPTGRAPHGRLPTASTPTSRADHRPSSTRRATLARRRPAPLLVARARNRTGRESSERP